MADNHALTASTVSRAPGDLQSHREELIITAASERYSAQVLALIGSLNCNWPAHPEVIVYDIGLEAGTIGTLERAGIEVHPVPAFCDHWRKHYTWKFWCWNDAPARRILWLDAGCCVLRPLPEIFEVANQIGYFAIPNYRSLELEASEEGCKGCGVPPDFRIGRGTVAAGVFAFSRGTAAERLVQECLQVALTERYIKAYKPSHRHDQQVLSLLLHRDIHPLILGDGTIYSYGEPAFSAGAIWAARRGMHPKDLRHFADCVGGSAEPHVPRRSHKRALWYRVAWFLYQVVSVNADGARAPSDGVRDK